MSNETIRLRFPRSSRRTKAALSGFLLLAATACLGGCNRTPPATTSDARKVPAPVPTLPEGVRVGKKAKEIAGTTLDGKKISLNDFRGKVVLVDFWAVWCGPCRAAFPHEKKTLARYQGKPFAILGVMSEHELNEEFLRKNPLPWPNIVDSNDGIIQQWKVSGLPTFVLIDHQGLVVNRWEGIGEMDKIDEAIEEAVGAAEQAKLANSQGG